MFCLGVKLHTCKWKGNDTSFPPAQLGGEAGKWVVTRRPLQLGQRQGEIPKMAHGYHFLLVARETGRSAYTSLPVPWLPSCCRQTRRNAPRVGESSWQVGITYCKPPVIGIPGVQSGPRSFSEKWKCGHCSIVLLLGC